MYSYRQRVADRLWPNATVFDSPTSREIWVYFGLAGLKRISYDIILADEKLDDAIAELFLEVLWD